MKIVIEIDTDQFDAANQTPRAAAAQVSIILDRFIHGRAGEAPNGFLSRGVLGGDLIALHDTNGTHVGAYSVLKGD